MSSRGADSVYARLLTRAPLPIASAVPAVTGNMVTVPCLLLGWSLRETAGAAATIEFFSGGSTGGTLVGVIALAASGAETDPVGGDGLLCEGGLFLNVVSGSVKVVAWVKM